MKFERPFLQHGNVAINKLPIILKYIFLLNIFKKMFEILYIIYHIDYRCSILK